MKKIYVIAPVSALSKRLRLYKLASYINETYPSCVIKHIGWERAVGESSENRLEHVHIEKDIILRGGGYGSRVVKPMYVLWMLRVFIKALTIPKHSKVWALGFESAFPLLLVGKFKKFEIYFDDADRFSLLFDFYKPIKTIIQQLEILTSRNVYKHLVPSLSRYEFTSPNLTVLRNIPSKKELSIAKKIYEKKTWPTSKVVIYVNGWLGATRGLATALKLSEAFDREELIIILAGRIGSDEAELLRKRSNVLYLGNVNNAEALAPYYASDFVFTYYDPSIEINQLAESNKWGDAKCTGCRVIINKEVNTFEAGPNDIVCPYSDTDQLISVIRSLTLTENNVVNDEEFFEKDLEAII